MTPDSVVLIDMRPVRLVGWGLMVVVAPGPRRVYDEHLQPTNVTTGELTTVN
jgi:hypothetical protein